MAKRKRRVARNLRTTIAVGLVAFVLVASGVVARRMVGVQQQRGIQDLQRKRDALIADRVRLEGAIRDASSRARLQPIAEQRLNMHIPKPDEQVIVPRAPRSTSKTTKHDSL